MANRTYALKELRPFSSILELRHKIKLMTDIIYAKHGHDRLKLFDTMLSMFLVKMYDESINENELKLPKIVYDENNDIINEFNNLFIDAVNHYKFNHLYLNLQIDKDVLLSCLKILMPYSLKYTIHSDGQTEILGTFYQEVVSSTFRGSLGAYLTPKPVCDLAVGICEPTIEDTIFDTSCGTGTFLLTANNARSKPGLITNIFGIDIQERMVLTTTLNALFRDEIIPHIIKEDGLRVTLDEWNKKDKAIPIEGFSLIVGNPPFAGYEENFKISSEYIINGTQRGASKRLHKIIPFIYKILSMLKKGGRAAIVIPKSVLNAESAQYNEIREVLKRHTHITAIIGLPKNAFIHTDCGVEGALLFFTKEKISDESKTFITAINNLGYDRRGKSIPGSEINNIIDKWKNKLDKDFINTKLLYKEDRLDPKWIDYKVKMRTNFNSSTHVRLTEILEIINEKISKTHISLNSSYSYFELRDANMNTGIVEQTHDILGSELIKKSRLKLQVKNGELLLPNHRDSLMAKSSRGIGRSVVLVTDNLDGCITSNRFMRIRPKIDALVLSTILNSYLVREQLIIHSRGSASFDITNKVLYKVWIPKEILSNKNIKNIKTLVLKRYNFIEKVCDIEKEIERLID